MYNNLNSQLFLHHKTRIYVLTQIFLNCKTGAEQMCKQTTDGVQH